MLTADEALDDSHAVGGEGPGLVGADRRSVAHRLTRVKVAHQVVVMHHFLSATQPVPPSLVIRQTVGSDSSNGVTPWCLLHQMGCETFVFASSNGA